jgi:hypothetical protein
LKNLLLKLSNRVVMMKLGRTGQKELLRDKKLVSLKRTRMLMFKRRGGPRKEVKDHHLLMMMIIFLSLLRFLPRGRRLLPLNLQESLFKLLKVSFLRLMFLALLKLNMHPHLAQT